ncbi:MAG: cupin domain-containing protein [Bacteroidales bacterium]|nr:cupin domain-containing protein [Bacteroidales bacterium]
MKPINLHDVNSREIIPGYRARFVNCDNMTLAFWDITVGSPMPEHYHPNEQVTTLLEGEFMMTIGGETFHLKPGSVLVIPPNVGHKGHPLTDCRILDVFYPRREEYQ